MSESKSTPDVSTLVACTSSKIRLYRCSDGSFRQGPQLSGSEYKHPSTAVAWNPKGLVFAVGNQDGSITISSPQRKLTEFQQREPVLGVCFSSTSRYLAAVSVGVAQVWDLKKPKAPLHVLHPKSTFTCCEFRPNTSDLALGESNGTVSIFSASHGSYVREGIAAPQNSSIAAVSFPSRGKPPMMLTTSRAGAVVLWDISQNPCKVLWTMEYPTPELSRGKHGPGYVGWTLWGKNASASVLSMLGIDGRLLVLDMSRDQSVLFDAQVATQPIGLVGIGDGRILLIGDGEGFVKLYNTELPGGAALLSQHFVGAPLKCIDVASGDAVSASAKRTSKTDKPQQDKHQQQSSPLPSTTPSTTPIGISPESSRTPASASLQPNRTPNTSPATDGKHVDRRQRTPGQNEARSNGKEEEELDASRKRATAPPITPEYSSLRSSKREHLDSEAKRSLGGPEQQKPRPLSELRTELEANTSPAPASTPIRTNASPPPKDIPMQQHVPAFTASSRSTAMNRSIMEEVVAEAVGKLSDRIMDVHVDMLQRLDDIHSEVRESMGDMMDRITVLEEGMKRLAEFIASRRVIRDDI